MRRFSHTVFYLDEETWLGGLADFSPETLAAEGVR
jgi:hypothetical protein